MRRSPFLPAAALAALSLSAAAQPAMPDPTEAAALAARFCEARLAADEAATRRLLSSGLVSLIEEAAERNDAVAASAPEDEPPLADGVPYQAFPDVAPVCEAGEVVARGGRVIATVAYRFPGRAGSDWSDRLLVVSEDGEARIDDVLYPRFTTDSVEYGLRRSLRSMFDLR